MPQYFSLCFLLANTLLGLAMATNTAQITLQSISPTSSNTPSQSPYSDQRTYSLEVPLIGRKLGKHQYKQIRASYIPISPTPSEALPQSEKKIYSSSERRSSSIPSHQRTSIEPHDGAILGSYGQVHLLKQHHHSFDKSIAGGGVILGGLATTFLVSIFCYIKATGRHKSETDL